MIEHGCILLARKIQESEIWGKPSDWLKIWIYILQEVNHTDNKLFQRGENFFNYNDIVRECRVTYDSVAKFMKWAKSATLVATRKTTRGIVIEVLKYKEYQELGNYKGDMKSNMNGKIEAKQKQNRSYTINKNDINDNNENIISPNKEIGETPKITEEDNILLSEKKPVSSNKLSDKQKIASKQEHKQMIDDMLVFLQNKLKEKGIANFKNDNETLRRRVWNIIQMVIRQTDPLPREELLRRLNIILNDPHKLLNCWLTPDKEIHKCNDIDRLFEAIKGFVEPNNSQTTSNISIY